MSLRRTVAKHPRLRNAAYGALRGRARLARGGDSPTVLVNSVPKAGTHLVTTMLEAFPDLRPSWMHVAVREFGLQERAAQPVLLDREEDVDQGKLARTLRRPKRGQYVTGHLFPYPSLLRELAELDYRVVFVTRDPRDIVVSMAAYMTNLGRHPQSRRFTEELQDPEARLLATIEGYPARGSAWAGPPFGRRLAAYEPWLRLPGTTVCSFERLVGPKGGGDESVQVDEILRVAEGIERPLTRTQAERIAAQTWSTQSATFRAGTVGGWRDAFTPAVTRAFREQVGDDLLRSFGYEPGD